MKSCSETIHRDLHSSVKKKKTTPSKIACDRRRRDIDANVKKKKFRAAVEWNAFCSTSQKQKQYGEKKGGDKRKGLDRAYSRNRAFGEKKNGAVKQRRREGGGKCTCRPSAKEN